MTVAIAGRELGQGNKYMEGAAILRRARRMANVVMHTIELQVRRIDRIDSDDDRFALRKFVDCEFLAVALWRLRCCALAVAHIVQDDRITAALSAFDEAFPKLKRVRDVLLHTDDYIRGHGHNSKVRVQDLEVGVIGDEAWQWIGATVRIDDAPGYASRLYQAIRDSCPSV